MITRSNRTGNRVILAVVGLVAIVIGAALLVPQATALGLVPASAAGVVAAALAVAAAQPVVVATAAAVVVVLAAIWAFSRGRGRTPTAYADREVAVDVHAVEQLLRNDLGPVPEVLAVSVRAYRLRRRTALRVEIEVRRGSDLVRLRDRIRAAADTLDARLGDAPTLLVHLRSGVRASVGRERRTV